MRIVASGILSAATPGTTRGCLTFPTITRLSSGELLATARAGKTKDCDREFIEFYRSGDNGTNWSTPQSPFQNVMVDGRFGTLKICYLTEISPGHLLAAAMWVDRTTHPGKPLFNAQTEGCLPMAILLADSLDFGHSWSDSRQVLMAGLPGPPSLTNPILKLADGRLAISIETNKDYDDASDWHQSAVFLFSSDQGQNWSAPTSVAEDALRRIFNWDLRCCVAPDGRVASFAWTYDTHTERYLNIYRRISHDNGSSWSIAEDLGFADQAGPPVILPDGRLVLAWVDRFGSRAIKLNIAPAIDAPFDQNNSVTIYRHGDHSTKTVDGTGDLLADMAQWSFGLPYVQDLGNGQVMVVYYACAGATMDLHWTRLSI